MPSSLERTSVNNRNGGSFDLPGKLDEISVMIASTRSGVFRLEVEMLKANSNLTVISNTTRSEPFNCYPRLLLNF